METIIGSLNWAITLGRFDIQYATSTMARYNMSPKEGHMTAFQWILGYSKKTSEFIQRLLINPKQPEHEEYECFNYDNWKEFYPDAEEEIPYDILPERGPKAKITIWVDEDHAHDQVTRRSVSGIVIMINRMIWKTISKRQKTVETSTYGSELVASRMTVEQGIALRYTLRMLGVGLEGSILTLCY